MGKLSPELLFVLTICIICLPLLLADTSCPHVPGTTCSESEDKAIMECCLKNYTRGFETLPKCIAKRSAKSEDPPSCRLDLDLAKCLSHSRCYAQVTNALRLLIFNQLVFTKRVGLCNRNKFDKLLNEAKNENVKGLREVEEMRDMEDNEAYHDCAIEVYGEGGCATKVYDKCGCATKVYGICGRRFREELQNNPLCTVFIREGNCTTIEAHKSNCISPVLTRFKQNSNKAAFVVLPALCSPPSSK